MNAYKIFENFLFFKKDLDIFFKLFYGYSICLLRS